MSTIPRIIPITATRNAGTAAPLSAFVANPLTFRVSLDVTRPSATGLETITAEIRRSLTDLTDPLAVVTLEDPTGAGPFDLDFTGAQLNQDLDGAEKVKFWLVIYATADGGDELDVIHTGPFTLTAHAASQVAGAPPNTVGPLTRAQADALYATIATAAGKQPKAIASIAALKAVTVASYATGDSLDLLGYYAAGDGGGGSFRYDSASAATDNGGTVIAPTAGSGRWIRVDQTVLTPRMFGAKGDGSTNDYPAFAALGLAVPAIYGQVVIPPGDYKIGGQFVLTGKNGVRISGPGKITQTVANNATVMLIGCARVLVEGMHLVGLGTDFNPAANTGAIGIYCESCTNVMIRNNRIENFGNAGVEWYLTARISIIGNHISGTGTGDGGAQDNYQFGVFGYGNDGIGYPGVTIANNIIELTTQGIFTPPDQDDISITGNIIRDIRGQHAMYLCGGNNGCVANNVIDGTSLQGIKLVNQSTLVGSPDADSVGWVVSGNTIGNTGSWGIAIFQQGHGDYPGNDYIFRGLQVTGNNISGADLDGGITVRDSVDVNISHNVIKDVTGSGIYTLLVSGQIDNNIINDTTASGMRIYGGRSGGVLAIRSNRITSPATAQAGGTGELAQGIYVTGETAGQTYDIIDNRIDIGTGAPGYAVRVTGPGATVNLRGTVTPTLANFNSCAVTDGDIIDALTLPELRVLRNEAGEPLLARIANTNAAGFTRAQIDRVSSSRYALWEFATAGVVDWYTGLPYANANYMIGTGVNPEDSKFTVSPLGSGYFAGNGGAVTQATSKSTGVTLNKFTGRITMDAASLAANTAVSFTLTCDDIAATDTIITNISSGATANAYLLSVTAVASGSCRFQLYNLTGGALAEAVVIQYNVFKGAAT